MNNRPIGIFDWGLGGLTTVKQIIKELPDENIVYFGDTGRVPYGTRSNETILKYTRSDIRFLMSLGVKIIVIACGTASSASMPKISGEFDVPVIGVVEATAESAVKSTRNKKIGIIGTSATINSGSYEKHIHMRDNSVETFAKACPLFVPLVENGHFDTPVARLVTEEYLTDIKASGVDTLILGCTHFPLLRKVISDFMGNDVTLIDAGAEVAKYLKRKFDADMLHSSKRDNEQYRYYVSDNIDGFEELGGIFLERKINGQVSKIDIEKY